MHIHFSGQDNLRNFRQFLNTFDTSNQNHLTVTLDQDRIAVHPAYLTLAAALAIKVGKENSTIIGSAPKGIQNLVQMGLYNYFSTPATAPHSNPEQSGRFIPLRAIKTAQEQSTFIADFVPLLHLPESQSRIIRYVIGELVRNVLEHSYSKNGAIVAAKYYEKSHKVSLAICDTGIGIWHSMSDNWHPQTDLDAIELALTPGISGTTRKEGGTFENAGAGLFYVRSIAKTTRNYFLIYSGKAEYLLYKWDKRLKLRLTANPFKEEHFATNDAPDFPGTLVALDISLDSTPEFNELLHDISTTYDEAIRERRRKKFYAPNFERNTS